MGPSKAARVLKQQTSPLKRRADTMYKELYL